MSRRGWPNATRRASTCRFSRRGRSCSATGRSRIRRSISRGISTTTSLALCSLIFGGVLERLPALRIAFAHGGGAFPTTIGRIVHGFDVRPDLCAVSNDVSPREYLRRIYLDSLVHDPLMLRYLVDLMGP